LRDIRFADQSVGYLIVVDSIDILLNDGRQCMLLDIRDREQYNADIFEIERF